MLPAAGLLRQHIQKSLEPNIGIGAGVGIIVRERAGILKPEPHVQQHDLFDERQLACAGGVAFVEPIKPSFHGVGERLARFINERSPQGVVGGAREIEPALLSLNLIRGGDLCVEV